LVVSGDTVSSLENFHASVVDLVQRTSSDLGDITGTGNEVVWAEPGKSVLFSRTLNGLTNIWKFALNDKALTQITFGTGPDTSPMADPNGKGIYIVSGKSSGFLTVYDVKTKTSSDIASENATQPSISPDGKHVMYLTIPAKDRDELWVANIDGSDKVKLSTAGALATGNWAPDNSHLSFVVEETGKTDKAYLVAADGSGLHQLTWSGGTLQNVLWVSDQKSVVLISFEKGGTGASLWRENVEGSAPEKIGEDCGSAFDVASGGQHLLTEIAGGEKIGIYDYSVAEKKCTLLVPGVSTFGALLARDGKSFLYAIPSRKDVTIYRQNWQPGKAIGQPQVVLKLPFSFPLISGGNAYDFARDLSTVVYARPGGHADLYLVSQK